MPRKLPPYVATAMVDAGLALADRDARGLMPLAKARAILKPLRRVVKGRGRDVSGTYVLDSDLAWAAVLSLADDKELLETARLEWHMPPRGIDNPAVAERYGEGAIPWVAAYLAKDDEGPAMGCLAATVMACKPTRAAFDCMLKIDRLQPDPLHLWQWLKKHPGGWKFFKSGGEEVSAAIERLVATDEKGARAALARVGVGDGATAGEKGGRRGITIGDLEPHFRSFEYPMWDNANYFTGAIRVTGFVCGKGEALVWEQLSTGLGDNNVRREVTVHASFPLKRTWRVHVQELLSESQISKWDGEDETSLLTAVTRKADGTYVVASSGARKVADIRGVGKVPIAVDTKGLTAAELKLLEKNLGPVERLIVRLGQHFRAKVFAAPARLAKEAGLPGDAKAAFHFETPRMPDAGQPAASSADIVAMVEALASRKPLKRLPTKPGHPLRSILERCRELGGWGDARMCG